MSIWDGCTCIGVCRPNMATIWPNWQEIVVEKCPTFPMILSLWGFIQGVCLCWRGPSCQHRTARTGSLFANTIKGSKDNPVTSGRGYNIQLYEHNILLIMVDVISFLG